MNEKFGWFIHVECIVLFITLIGGFYTLDGKIERLTCMQAQRTDRLYEMFIDLVKETKKA